MPQIAQIFTDCRKPEGFAMDHAGMIAETRQDDSDKQSIEIAFQLVRLEPGVKWREFTPAGW